MYKNKQDGEGNVLFEGGVPKTPINHISLSEFYRRMEIVDHAAILDDAKSDSVMAAFIERLKAAAQDKGYIDMNHPDMVEGRAKIKSKSTIDDVTLDKLFK